jgi:hypothetical protein
MRRQLVSYTIGICLHVISPSISWSQAPDPKATLGLIADTADRICYVIAQNGSVSNLEARGAVSVELKGLASRLAGAGINGSGSITNDEYQGVLRNELATTIRESTACKLKVFDSLQAKLLSVPPAAVQAPIPPPTSGLARVNAVLYREFGIELGKQHNGWAGVSPKSVHFPGRGSFMPGDFLSFEYVSNKNHYVRFNVHTDDHKVVQGLTVWLNNPDEIGTVEVLYNKYRSQWGDSERRNLQQMVLAGESARKWDNVYTLGGAKYQYSYEKHEGRAPLEQLALALDD